MAFHSSVLAPKAVRPRWTVIATFRRSVVNSFWLLLPWLALPALLPFYTEGLPRSFDGGLHLLRIGLLDRYLRQGFIFPRWAPELLLGHGYPVFGYYAPASYYFVELFHLLGLSFYAAFVTAFVVLVVGAGYGMALLAQDSFGRERIGPILVAAVAYMYSPYLLTNVFIRGAIAETMALTLLPWIFWSARRTMCSANPASYVPALALSLGALAVTHNITLLFMPPVLIGYLVVLWWQQGRPRPNLGWTVGGLLLAMALSAFFWAPLVFERDFLAGTAYEIARTVWLPASAWTWDNFLDRGWTFTHTFDRPIRLGLVQLILALCGFVLGWRRNGEWLFWGFVALLATALISAWSLPLWLNSDILSVAQFTWRLLSILSLPLSLFAGGVLWRLHNNRYQAAAFGAATSALLCLIIWAQMPRLDWMDVFAPEGIDLSLPVFLQLEVDKNIIAGGASNSSIQEFRPRWADETLELAAADAQTQPVDIAIQRADAFGLAATIAVSRTTPLRFNDYYFPGRTVLLDGQTELQSYPSTNLGLLTVDVPPGTHTLELAWRGTALQRWSAWLSLAACASLLWLLWRLRPLRALALLPLVLLLVGLFAVFYHPTQAAVERPAQAVAGDGMKLLGFQWTRAPDGLYLYPYWAVSASPPNPVRARWQLQDQSGKVYVDVTFYPYFNSYRASNFPINSVVDDAYRLPLPPDLPAGEYWIALAIGETQDDLAHKPTIVGQVTLPEQMPSAARPRQRAHVIVNNEARLIGFDLDRFSLKRGFAQLTTTEQRPATVRAGDHLDYRLYWQAQRPMSQNYHGFVHLLNVLGQPLVQQDQMPGPFFHPPLLWEPYQTQTDTYLLRIPADAPSGLYWPVVGMYDFATLERLPMSIDANSDLGYDYRLPPIKVLNSPKRKPQQPLDITLHNLGALIGYDLSLDSPTVRAGEQFTVTLYYRSDHSTRTNYTRFLHLFSDELGMAAQQDGLPQQGVNPTTVWRMGEIIADPVTLTVPPVTAAGVYTLYTGLYDAQAGGERLPLTSRGEPLADNRAVLTQVTVRP